MTPGEALLKAKISLMNKSVFISSICLSLQHEFTNTIQTAATNGIKCLYNPDFFLDLTSEQRTFVVAHESWHVAFEHMVRCGVRDQQKYNRAADYVINLMLKKDNYDLPTFVLCDDQYDNMMTEEVYKLLPDDPESDNSGMMNDILAPPSDMSEEEIQQHIEDIIVKAKIQSKNYGKYYSEVPGEIQRTIENLLNPRIPWQIHLNRFMQEFCKDDYSWSRPNRRFMPDFYLPSLHRPAMKHVVTAFDTSGSVSQEELEVMTAETQHLKNQFQPDKLTILDCDCNLNQVIQAEHLDNLVDIKFKGGGGTMIEPVLDWCKNNPPTCLIYFTDLCFNFPTKPPSFPILWINTDTYEDSIPDGWGQLINLR